MELILRVCTASGLGGRRDLIVDVEPSHAVADVAQALRRHIGCDASHACLTVIRTGTTLDPACPVADAELVSGDEVVLGPAAVGPDVRPLPERAVAADILAGPESGRSMLMLPGSYRVGRGAQADLVIDDPSVSRHHADVVVDEDWTVTVVPTAGAANGVTVNDRAVQAATVVEPDDVIALGGTRLALRRFERSVEEHVDRLGQIDFHRTPYRPPVVTERDDVTVGPIPERPEPRKLQILGVVAPLAAGLVMYAFSRQPQFLALTAVSPIVVVANVIEDRRSGRVRFGEQLRSFRAGLAGHVGALEARRRGERLERLRAGPDLAELSRRARLRTVDLWARGRGAPDFLVLRLGLGAAGVSYSVDLARGGADDLRDELAQAIDGLDRLDNVPITVDLTSDAVLGVHGPRALVDGVVASLAVQAATLHSPEDLTIVAAVAPERGFGWLKWLPHARTVASPLPGDHVVGTHDEASAVVARLVEVATFRSDDGRGSWPRILLLLDADLAPDPVAVSRLLDVCGQAGISVVWLAGSLSAVPRQAAQILGVRQGEGAVMSGRLWATDPSVDDRALEVEHLRSSLADDVARALAPVRDGSTASLATSIPRRVPLLDVLGCGRPTRQWISEQWQRRSAYDLRFPIGIAADGVLELDLVEHGPHTLIGGTSGAGKSELLQSMVAALAARHSPERLNFLFVDYKGGAASKVFERLPHTVGHVTNLSADLALRALTSLRAELERRMRVMEGRAKDLAGMLETAPADAPPSLVIVVDEFATLVKEVPEFVAGIVDLAQRGRSLGIHLVLATQRPSGSVNENIIANTNLRISLRVLDRSDSAAIIASPDAADIPVPLRGRAFARLGPRQLVEFQSAFAGAPLVTGEDGCAVLVAEFERTDDSPRRGATEPASPAAGSMTHLDALIGAIAEANAELALTSPPRPWRDTLPEVVELSSLDADPETGDSERHPGRFVTIGLLDAPERQEQGRAVVDLEESGGLLVFGSGGSGKTTLLRTVAASIAAASTSAEAAVIAFDFASRGLASIRALPEVVDVATGDDLEAVTRHLTLLDSELARRRQLFADAGAEHLTAYNSHRPALPRIVVLIDGFGAMTATFLNTGGSFGSASTEAWGELIQRLVVDGRQVGIHTVLTAERYGAVPARIHSAVAGRLVLRQAEATAYAELGISGERVRNLDLPPGRGLLQGTTLVQVASVSSDATARGQGERIAALANELGRPPTDVLRSTRLPGSIALDQLDKPSRRRLRPCLGVADLNGAPVDVDLEWTNLTVCGPPRSGRSTALATIVRSLASDHDVFVVGPAASPLARLELGVEPDRVLTARPEVLAGALDRIANLAAIGGDERPRLLVIDDVDRLDDDELTPLWDRIARLDDLRLVAAMESRSMSGFTQHPLLTTLRRSQRLLVLHPDDPSDFLAMTGVKLALRPGVDLPPGRGVLLVDREPTLVHVATPA